MSHSRILVLLVVPVLALAGCHDQPGKLAPPQPPAVPVSRPVQQEVTDYVDFTGRTDAVQTVNVVDWGGSVGVLVVCRSGAGCAH